MRLFLLLFLSVLGGCAHREEAANRPMTKCEMVSALLSNRSATPGQTMAALEFGKNYGCFGPTQPQAR